MRIIPGSCLIALGLSGCAELGLTGDHPTGTGPFDSRGNYVEAWADDPSKWNGRSVPETKPAREPETEVAPKTPEPEPAVVRRPAPVPSVRLVSNPKPKPKPPAPKFTSHKVRRGDTLYGLAKKYGTSVGAIQKANGLNSSLIRLGATLRIPR